MQTERVYLDSEFVSCLFELGAESVPNFHVVTNTGRHVRTEAKDEEISAGDFLLKIDITEVKLSLVFLLDARQAMPLTV